jgi:hypothetical protein
VYCGSQLNQAIFTRIYVLNEEVVGDELNTPMQDLLATERGGTSHLVGTDFDASSEIARTEGERHSALASERQATDNGDLLDEFISALISTPAEGVGRCSTPHTVRLLGRYLNSTTEGNKIHDLYNRAVSEHVERTRTAPLPGPVRLTKDENAQIVALYEAGLTPTQIAAELGTTEWTVHHRLNRNGVMRRPIGMTRGEVQEALRLNEEGVPITKLAVQFGRSWKTVAKELDAGRRSRGS